MMTVLTHQPAVRNFTRVQHAVQEVRNVVQEVTSPAIRNLIPSMYHIAVLKLSKLKVGFILLYFGWFFSLPVDINISQR